MRGGDRTGHGERQLGGPERAGASGRLERRAGARRSMNPIWIYLWSINPGRSGAGAAIPPALVTGIELDCLESRV
jgi:hypothetical protein